MANGNCLYNACSIAVTGNGSDISVILRCLTSIKLFENAAYYANHPIILSQHESGAFVYQTNAFAMCLSDNALKKGRGIPAVIEKARNNAKNYQFSTMLCFFALALVLGCTIESYYPITNDSAPQQEWNSLEKMFNCTVSPRQEVDVSMLETVHIFRCAAMPTRYLADQHIPDHKNHYVVLCKPSDDLELGENYFKPKLLLLNMKLNHVPQA
jgi:hypothetical protein